MEMNSPVGPNALDAQGIVGKPLDRVDGRLKVTGGARYAYEMQQDGVLYGFVVEASIGKGTIRSIDTRACGKGARRRAGSHPSQRARAGHWQSPRSAPRTHRTASDGLRPTGCLRGC